MFFFEDFTDLFLERGGEREKERERNIDARKKHQCVVASSTHPNWGPGLQPRHVPWLGIEPETFSFGGRMPNQLSHTGQSPNVLLQK